ncbi:unnamed protein product, partial [Didymodactylos carnosus]
MLIIPDPREEYSTQPNYAVLLDTRDRKAHKTYIPQEEIQVVTSTKIVNAQLEDYFELYDGAQYIMKPWMKEVIMSTTTKLTFVIDNGAYSAKSTFNNVDKPKIIPNCVMKSKFYPRRVFIGEQVITECPNKTSLYYQLPFQKGYLVDWNVQKSVWDHLFSKIPCKTTGLLITEPYMNMNFIRETMDQIFFEEYEFSSLARYDPASFSAYKYQNETKSNYVLVVDSGYSFTHIVPFYRGKKILEGIVRQLLVMNETYIINELKENVCFVSTDFNHDMKKARLPLSQNT